MFQSGHSSVLIISAHPVVVALQCHTRGSLLNAAIMCPWTGGAVRDELFVFCEETRLIFVIVGKPFAGLMSSAHSLVAASTDINIPLTWVKHMTMAEKYELQHLILSLHLTSGTKQSLEQVSPEMHLGHSEVLSFSQFAQHKQYCNWSITYEVFSLKKLSKIRNFQVSTLS